MGMFLLLISLTLVSATSTTWGTFKQRDTINLVGTCALLGCNQTNITIITYPNSTTAIQNQQASMSNIVFIYSFVKTDALGTYLVQGVSANNTKTIYWVGDFEVTTTGKEGKSFLLNPILIFLATFSLIFIILGISVKIPALGFIGSILMILAGIYTMIYGFGDVANLYTQGVAIALIGLGFIFMFSSAYEWFSF